MHYTVRYTHLIVLSTDRLRFNY